MSLKTPSKSPLGNGNDIEAERGLKTPECISLQKRHKWLNTISPLKWGRSHDHDINRSPKEITRRRSVKGLFSSIRSPRGSADGGQRSDVASGESVPVPPSKENAGFFAKGPSSPKRRKSFSDIFGTITNRRSLSRIESVPPHKFAQQEIPTTCFRKSVLEEQHPAFRCDMQDAQENSMEGYSKSVKPLNNLTKEPTASAWDSHLKEVSASQAFSAHESQQVSASDSDTLIPCMEQGHVYCDQFRSRTPDSYLAQLIDSHKDVQDPRLDDTMSLAPNTRIALPIPKYPNQTQGVSCLMGLNDSRLEKPWPGAELKSEDECTPRARDSSLDPCPTTATTINALREIDPLAFLGNEFFSLPIPQVENPQLVLQEVDHFSQPPPLLRQVESQHEIELQGMQLTAGDIAYGQEIRRARNIRLTVDNMTKNYYSYSRQISPKPTCDAAESHITQDDVATLPTGLRSPILRGREVMYKDRPFPRLRNVASPESSRMGLSLERSLEESSELRSSSNTVVELGHVSNTSNDIDKTTTADPPGCKLSEDERRTSENSELLSEIIICKSIHVPVQAISTCEQAVKQKPSLLQAGPGVEFVSRTHHQVDTGCADGFVTDNQDNKELGEADESSSMRTKILPYTEEAHSDTAKLENGSKAKATAIPQRLSISKYKSGDFSSGNACAFDNNASCHSSKYEMYMARERHNPFWLPREHETSVSPPHGRETADLELVLRQQAKNWMEVEKLYFPAENEQLVGTSVFGPQSNQQQSSQEVIDGATRSPNASWRRPEEYPTHEHSEDINAMGNVDENAEKGTFSDGASSCGIYGLSPLVQSYAITIEALRGENEKSANYFDGAVGTVRHHKGKQAVLDLVESTDFHKSSYRVDHTIGVQLPQDVDQNSSNSHEVAPFYSQFAEVARAESDIPRQERNRTSAVESGYNVVDPVYHDLKADMITSWKLRHAFLGDLQDCRDRFPAIFQRIVRDMTASPMVKDWFLAEQAAQSAPGPARMSVKPVQASLLHVFLFDRQNAPDTSKIVHENLQHVFLFQRPDSDTSETMKGLAFRIRVLKLIYGISELSEPQVDLQTTPKKMSPTGSALEIPKLSARDNLTTNSTSVIDPVQGATKRTLSESMIMAGAALPSAKRQNMGVSGLVNIFEAKGMIPQTSSSRLRGGASFASNSRSTPLYDLSSTTSDVYERPPSSIDNDSSLEGHSLMAQYKHFQTFDFGFPNNPLPSNIIGGSVLNNSFQELTHSTDEATLDSSDEQDAALYG